MAGTAILVFAEKSNAIIHLTERYDTYVSLKLGENWHNRSNCKVLFFEIQDGTAANLNYVSHHICCHK